jgi:hypothetical protein
MRSSSIKSTAANDAESRRWNGCAPMQKFALGVHDAAQLIRARREFYDSLTDDDRSRSSAAPPQAGEPCAMSRSDHGTDVRLASTRLKRRCGRSKQSLRPTKAQRAPASRLQKKSFEMGQFLMASCLRPMPATPAERLDAAADRLTAVIFAASNVNMALNDFTSQLSNEQKTKLNSLVR